ncbi:MAG: hypothetical protein Q4D27_08885 [Coriobacteriia bacterium]|nr:hypothetical protein [Coriobacteriia bacterium]
MNGDALMLAGVFLNSFLFLMSSFACAFMAMEAVFPRRRGLGVFVGYFLIKAIAVSTFDMLHWAGMDGGAVPAAEQGVMAIIGVAVLVVLYHTWDSSPLKLWVMALIMDVIAGLSKSCSLALCQIGFGLPFDLGYIGPFNPVSVLAPVFAAGFFWVLLQLMKPLARSIVTFEFKHERLWLALFIVLFAAMQCWQLMTLGSIFLTNFAMVYTLGTVMIPLVAAFVAVRLHMAGVRSRRLERSRAIMAACDDALRAQSAQMDESRALLDDIAARIGRLEAGAEREGLARYLEELHATCNRLRFGTYSDNPALDVVLANYEERFRAFGVRVEYRVTPLACAGGQAALAAQTLLEWAYGALGDGAIRASSTLGFRAFRRANQLCFEIRVPLASAGKQPRPKLRGSLLPAGTIVAQGQEGRSLFVRLLVRDNAAIA